MARLNIERQERLEPERIAHAVRRIEQLGYTITLRDNKKIQFTHKGKYDNAAEWRGDLERKPSLYQWRPIHEIEQMT